jgi:hypothetical protein
MGPEACSALFSHEILTSTSREIYATMADDFLAFYARTYSSRNNVKIRGEDRGGLGGLAPAKLIVIAPQTSLSVALPKIVHNYSL